MIYSYLCMRRANDQIMDKRKEIINEEELQWTACEPIISMTNAVPRQKKQTISIPEGVPQTVEMAIADIEAGEREFERGETFTHKEVMQKVWDKIDG